MTSLFIVLVIEFYFKDGFMSKKTSKKTAGARFSIGQIVDHKLFNYRGVIADVDPVYQETDIWYEPIAQSWPPRMRPGIRYWLIMKSWRPMSQSVIWYSRHYLSQ